MILEFLLQYIKVATLWFHKKLFLRKHKHLSRMLAEPDAFSFYVFSNFQPRRSPKSFFECHLGYSEVPASHKSGLLLIGASAFSVPILIFLSVLSSIRLFSFGFIFFMRYNTKPLQANVIHNSAERWQLMINGTLKMGGEQKRTLLVYVCPSSSLITLGPLNFWLARNVSRTLSFNNRSLNNERVFLIHKSIIRFTFSGRRITLFAPACLVDSLPLRAVKFSAAITRCSQVHIQYICICIYINGRKTWVQSQVEPYQRIKKWYLIPPCLILSIIRYESRVKWSNPGKEVAPFPAS